MTWNKTAVGITLMISLAGCAAPSVSRTSGGQAVSAATKRGSLDQAGEMRQMLNDVITAWLGRDKGGQADEPRVVVVLGGHLPAGFVPVVSGWTLVVVSEDDPESPPEQVRAGDTQYVFDYHSSYSAVKRLEKMEAGAKLPGPPARTVHIDDPRVLRIDAIRLNGNSGEVEISQNRHHNMGGSGATFHVKRTDQGWECTAGQMWVN